MSDVAVIDPSRADLGGNLRHGDDRSWCPALWRYLVERFAIQSVLDVGCGEGHAVDFFARIGLRAFGIDGSLINVTRAVTPIALVDLTRGPFVMPVDLVWSCEVAEHIDGRHVGAYLDTLTNGRVVAMTHAVPGQAGYHHVNCQPAEYWITHMAERGYELAIANNRYRAYGDLDTYFTYTGLVFLRR